MISSLCLSLHQKYSSLYDAYQHGSVEEVEVLLKEVSGQAIIV